MTEQEFLDAINSAKAFGYAEGMKASKPRELSDEEIYDCWVEADPTEYLPEMRMKDGSINTELITFVELILKKASEK